MALTVKEAVRKWGPEYLAICGLAKYFPVMNSESHIFFVNGDDSIGDDGVNRDGQIPDEPFLTITHALSQCSDDTNDFIFVPNYYQATGETWPIDISKSQVHVIGIGYSYGPCNWVQPTGDTAAFTISSGATGCEIAGFELGAGENHGCIEVRGSGVWNIHIHDCGFGSELGMTGAYGIRTGDGTHVGELIKALIENNRFGTNLTAAGIEISSLKTGPNSIRGCIIQDNLFEVNTGDIGISVAKAGADFGDGGIFDNKFILQTDVEGMAITLVATVVGGFVDGNIASVLANEASMDNNPYLTTTACGPAWGLNYKGSSELAVAPAL